MNPDSLEADRQKHRALNEYLFELSSMIQALDEAIEARDPDWAAVSGRMKAALQAVAKADGIPSVDDQDVEHIAVIGTMYVVSQDLEKLDSRHTSVEESVRSLMMRFRGYLGSWFWLKASNEPGTEGAIQLCIDKRTAVKSSLHVFLAEWHRAVADASGTTRQSWVLADPSYSSARATRPLGPPQPTAAPISPAKPASTPTTEKLDI